jgi:SP family general alpha glucoside:H+ symporter-like MFS transporter
MREGRADGSIITEVPSTRLRSKTVVFARSCFLLTAVFMVVLTNYQINATAWNCESSISTLKW